VLTPFSVVAIITSTTTQQLTRIKIMSLFNTKDLTVSKAIIAVTHTESKVEFFIDMNNGKGITSAKTLDEAIEFAKAYQKLLG
jgi:hypothetical protein